MLLLLLSFLMGLSRAFVPVVQQRFPQHSGLSRPTPPVDSYYYQPVSLQRQRKSVASVQTMGLFGLGAPEIAVILVAAAFLLGPQKLAELGKDAGKVSSHPSNESRFSSDTPIDCR